MYSIYTQACGSVMQFFRSVRGLIVGAEFRTLGAARRRKYSFDTAWMSGFQHTDWVKLEEVRLEVPENLTCLFRFVSTTLGSVGSQSEEPHTDKRHVHQVTCLLLWYSGGFGRSWTWGGLEKHPAADPVWWAWLRKTVGLVLINSSVFLFPFFVRMETTCSVPNVCIYTEVFVCVVCRQFIHMLTLYLDIDGYTSML